MADWRNGRVNNNGRTEAMLEEENSAHVDGLSSKISRLKGLALDIESDTKDSNRYLDGMGTDFDSSQGLLTGSMNRISHMINSGKSNRKMMCYIIMGLSALFFLSYYLVLKVRA
ncbi:isoform X2 [Octopus vulgaris]|uniref:Isoform X2 n=1 Tax=Octopus vulgaris TaxID=6645 RepID=A0AA36C054_OCTVU|nr:isoform X2 [Octopus vulgaris]